MWHPKSVRIIVIPIAALAVGLALCAATLVIALGVRPAAAGPNANPGAPNPGHVWTEIEGHGIDSAGWWLGTIASNALELRVNGVRALRLEPNATSPNVIGGYSGNSVTAGAYGATISGGGSSGAANQAEVNYATVGGGQANTASGGYATVPGGVSNTAGGFAATVGGGYINAARNDYSTVGGGHSNTASGSDATIGGGAGNGASGTDATIGGGDINTAGDVAATVGGGESNTANGVLATVGGGYANTASSQDATVGGGHSNTASGGLATVGGGYSNMASGTEATVGGGVSNTASGNQATVPGGSANTAAGNYSFAAGYRAQANHPGAFVWADSTGSFFPSSAANMFQVRASGGYGFYTDPSATTGVYLLGGSGSWSSFSSRDVKENFTPVDGQEVLASLANVPVSTWNYKAQDASIRHMGPVAQDFSAAFGLGESDTGISTVDADGVAMAGIQGLYQLSQEQASRIQTLEAQVTALEGANGTNNSASAGLFSSGLSIGWLPIGGLLLAGLVLVQRRRAGGKR